MVNKQRLAGRVFDDYVAAAAGAPADIEFVLDHLGVRIPVDCSEESLERLEKLYWGVREGAVQLPPGLVSVEELPALLARYLGHCIVTRTGGQWVEARERNRREGQPCVDRFGNQPWERIYPVELAKNFATLPETNPAFPGVRERRVLATQLARALRIAGRETSS